MSISDDMKETARETRDQVNEYRVKAKTMREATSDLERTADEMEIEVSNLEKAATQEEDQERRAKDAIDKADRA